MGSRHMQWKAAGGIAWAIVLLTNAVRGAPPTSLRVVGEEGACPTAGEVATVLERLLVRTKVAPSAGSPGAGDASISDEGPYYRVRIAGHERSFVDAARQCQERARHAAVFVALILDPPMVPEPPLPASSPAPPPAEQLPQPPRGERATPLDLTFTPVFQVAPASSNRRTAVTGGVAVRARSKNRLNLSLSGGLLYGALHFGEVDAAAWWIPIDLAVGVSSRSGQWEIATEIGPNASVLSIIAENLPQARRQTRLELGGRVSTSTRFWLNEKAAVFLSADMIARPSPYTLRIEGEGDIGTTPAVWLGGAIGLTCEIN